MSDKLRSILVSVCVLVIGILIGMFINQILPVFKQQEGDEEFRKNRINFSRSIALSVGEKVVIHGKRGKCGELPAPIEKIVRKLPVNLETGKLSTGKLGVRYSRSCSGETPVREIIFEATKAGTEIVRLYGDDITVTIAE